MPLQAEIQNKEKSLAELMARLLQAPLDPMARSIQKIGDDLLEAQDRLKVIDDLCHQTISLGLDTCTANAQNKRMLGEFGKDLSTVKQSLTEQVKLITQDQRLAIDAAMAAHANQGTVLLQTITDLLSRAFSATSANQAETIALIVSARDRVSAEMSRAQGEHADHLARHFVSAATAAAASNEAIHAQVEAIGHRLGLAVGEAASSNGSAHQKLLQEFQSLRDAWESRQASLSAQADAGVRAATREIREILDSNHALMIQRHGAIEKKMTDFQRSATRQTVVVCLLVVAVLSAVTFELASRFT